jgi:hypothetical protein
MDTSGFSRAQRARRCMCSLVWSARGTERGSDTGDLDCGLSSPRTGTSLQVPATKQGV